MRMWQKNSQQVAKGNYLFERIDEDVGQLLLKKKVTEHEMCSVTTLFGLI